MTFKWQLRNTLLCIFCSLTVLLTSTHTLLAASLGESIGFSPRWDWKQMETEHFRLYFPAELSEIAQKSANYLELAHQLLSPQLRWEPYYKVPITLVDNVDSANGLTSPLYRFGIALIVTPPDNWFSTTYYDDWLWLLIVHEYTHYLNMDATRSFYAPLRYMFGDVFLPNGIWPNWMIEGLAVYNETRWTQSGRGRSPYYNMVVRAAVEADGLDDPSLLPLDRINGPNPWYPGGETAYLYGYQLMQQLASDPNHKKGEAALSELTETSSARVPFFIQGNLENIAGKDWYKIWQEWIQKAKVTAHQQLDVIHKQPTSSVQILTKDHYFVLGSALSPDGRWLAYTAETYDKSMGLFLMDLNSGHSTKLFDKTFGSQIVFTPDSKHIIFSAVHRSSRGPLGLGTSLDSEYSDLGIYSLEAETVRWLSDQLRARDPDISADGKTLIFTLTEGSTIHLAWAPLHYNEEHIELGPIEKVYSPPAYSTLSNPKFFLDGEKVVFSQHTFGKAAEDLFLYQLGEEKPTSLISNGFFNRHPFISLSGDIYFISDLTGVDNVYRLPAGKNTPLRVTNLTTGAWFPNLPQDLIPKEAYLTVYTARGWELAKVPLGQFSNSPIDLLPAPQKFEKPSPASKTYPVESYSIFPSIWPRQWTPSLFLYPEYVYFGYRLMGFDATDRHRYSAGAAYNTLTESIDWMASYTHRSVGPTFGVLAKQSTDAVINNGTSMAGDTYYTATRTTTLGFSVEFPIQWTYSALYPFIDINFQRTSDFQFTKNPSGTREDAPNNFIISEDPYLPNIDAGFIFNNSRSSRLGTIWEEGRQLFAATRMYVDQDRQIWKAVLTDQEFYHLGNHFVLSPTLKASYSNRIGTQPRVSDVIVQGRSSSIFGAFPQDNLDQIAIRGYPLYAYHTQAATQASADFTLPLLNIYRGAGLLPAFLRSLTAFCFAESTWFPNKDYPISLLPSVGGGIRLNTQLFIRVPLSFSIEYQYGFAKTMGGRSDFFLQMGLGSFDI